MIEDFITKETQDILYTKDFPRDLLMPTQALVQKWLREVKKIDIEVLVTIKADKPYTAENRQYTGWAITFENIEDSEETIFDTYEEALEDAIKAALTII
jgi:glucuronate isomerase